MLSSLCHSGNSTWDVSTPHKKISNTKKALKNRHREAHNSGDRRLDFFLYLNVSKKWEEIKFMCAYITLYIIESRGEIKVYTTRRNFFFFKFPKREKKSFFLCFLRANWATKLVCECEVVRIQQQVMLLLC